MAKVKERRQSGGNVLAKMAEADGWVMVRFPRAIPFVVPKSAWERCPIAIPIKVPK